MRGGLSLSSFDAVALELQGEQGHRPLSIEPEKNEPPDVGSYKEKYSSEVEL
jgi:hypothetical protein